MQVMPYGPDVVIECRGAIRNNKNDLPGMIRDDDGDHHNRSTTHQEFFSCVCFRGVIALA